MFYSFSRTATVGVKGLTRDQRGFWTFTHFTFLTVDRYFCAFLVYRCYWIVCATFEDDHVVKQMNICRKKTRGAPQLNV